MVSLSNHGQHRFFSSLPELRLATAPVINQMLVKAARNAFISRQKLLKNE
jgi:hypothetical protein